MMKFMGNGLLGLIRISKKIPAKMAIGGLIIIDMLRVYMIYSALNQ